MGWFDKKSWQLRRKIRDLQSELAVAEREGKYVVEQGLFFAELRDMADNTIMVLGTADHLDSEEEDIIRNFFDRNGFSVEALRLDKTQKTLAAVEIIPPQELTRRVARTLKDNGYRLIDDADKERPANLENKVITLSSLIRATSALFSAHVHQLIISTPIKMNMEGNRLLHWLPLIREALMRKVSPEVINVCREPFVDAYNHYYGRFGHMENPDSLEAFADETSATGDGVQTGDDSSGEVDTTANEETPPWVPPPPDTDAAPSTLASRTEKTPLFARALEGSSGDRTIEAAFALAQMYKALIGASDQRRVRNAELILDNIARFYSAKSACLLTRRAPDAPLILQANSYGAMCIETTEDGAVACETDQLQKAITAHAVTVIAPSGNGNSNANAVVAPINLEGDTDALIYLTEAADFTAGKNHADSENLAMFARVFREFPDLLIGEFAQKD